MATITERLTRNQPGSFYVDASCIDCDGCRNIAPAFFSRDEELGFSIVHRQPANAEEILLAQEAMDLCPTGSIGNDGTALSG